MQPFGFHLLKLTPGIYVFSGRRGVNKNLITVPGQNRVHWLLFIINKMRQEGYGWRGLNVGVGTKIPRGAGGMEDKYQHGTEKRVGFGYATGRPAVGHVRNARLPHSQVQPQTSRVPPK